MAGLQLQGALAEPRDGVRAVPVEPHVDQEQKSSGEATTNQREEVHLAHVSIQVSDRLFFGGGVGLL